MMRPRRAFLQDRHLRRQQTIRAALLDIFETSAGAFLAKRATIGDQAREQPKRLTLDATRHHAASTFS